MNDGKDNSPEHHTHMLMCRMVLNNVIVPPAPENPMNADVEKAVEYMRALVRFGNSVTRDHFECLEKALRDQEAEIARHIKMLADCFRMAGADPDGNEDWRLAPDALRAVTDLRRDYDEVIDWQDRAEKAEAKIARLSEVPDLIPTSWLDPMLSGPSAVLKGYDYKGPDIERLLNAIRDRITAHLGGEHE